MEQAWYEQQLIGTGTWLELFQGRHFRQTNVRQSEEPVMAPTLTGYRSPLGCFSSMRHVATSSTM